MGATIGEQGYGIRDNAGLLEFKNSGGAWESIQSIVFNLVGGSGSITGTLLYPDGPNGTPIPFSTETGDYTVPAGKTLYILSVQSQYLNSPLLIDEINVITLGQSTTPVFMNGFFVVGAGSVVSDVSPTYSIVFNGYLADAN